MAEPKSETQKWMEQAYAGFRHDGFSHGEAMRRIKIAMDEAIPKAVADIMAEISPPLPPPMCNACNGFGYIDTKQCSVCAGVGRAARPHVPTQTEVK